MLAAGVDSARDQRTTTADGETSQLARENYIPSNFVCLSGFLLNRQTSYLLKFSVDSYFGQAESGRSEISEYLK